MNRIRSFFRGALILALLSLPACQARPSLAITFGGDVILARDGQALFTQANPWGAAQDYLEQVARENSTALFFVNLESPLEEESAIQAETDSSGYDLCSEVSLDSILIQGGVDLVSIANNHNQDCAPGGGIKTRELLEKDSISAAGPDFDPVYLQSPIGKIAVMAVEDVTGPIDPDLLAAQIQTVRPNCDFLIVSIHWGNEYQAGSSQRQRDLAQIMADAGADVVWGHHPHVLQAIEWVQSATDGKQVLVMYSLGNLLADQWMSADTQRTALLTLEIQEGKIVGISSEPLMIERSTQSLVVPDAETIQKIKERLGMDELED